MKGYPEGLGGGQKFTGEARRPLAVVLRVALRSGAIDITPPEIFGWTWSTEGYTCGAAPRSLAAGSQS